MNRELRGVAAAQRSREQHLDEHADAPGLVKRIERIVSDRIENAVANDMIETPEYLRDLIGDYRTTKHPERWLSAARDVERHRLTHEIDDPVLAFGERPPDWADALQWDKQHEHVIELTEPEHVIARTRGIGMHM